MTPDGVPESAHSFPPVSASVANGTASAQEEAAFLDAFDRWRVAAAAWLRDATERADISPALRDLLLWTLGYPVAADRPPSRYVVDQIPWPGDDRAGAILAWRSGIVDFLSDVWDTLGPADFELQECSRTIDEIFTPAILRGIAHCPDCLQLRTADPTASPPYAEQHVLNCPIRLRRLLS